MPPARAEDEVKPDEGVLLIYAIAHSSTAPRGDSWVRGVWLKNLKTGKSYGNGKANFLMIVMPEGDYCLDEVNLFSDLGSISFCHEPFIHIERGRLNNAGEWTFVYDVSSGSIKLEGSQENSEKTLENAKKYYPSYF